MTTSLKTLFAATTILAATFGLGTAANAGPIHDLPSCYNHVINVCNQTSKHPEDCVENATNACDEEFGNQAAGTLPNSFAPPVPRPGPTGLLLPAVQQAREAAR